MKTNKTIELVNMKWQTRYYSESQITKSLPLTDEDRREGALSKTAIATQYPKILRIGLMLSYFYPTNINREGDFKVPNVRWLLEYYNMNGAQPFSDDKQDLPRTELHNCVEDLLSEVDDIIHNAEYQPAEFMNDVIKELCAPKKCKIIDSVSELDNVYRVENSLEMKKSIMAWLLGITYESVDDAIKQIQVFRERGYDYEEALTAFVRRTGRLEYIRSVKWLSLRLQQSIAAIS